MDLKIDMKRRAKNERRGKESFYKYVFMFFFVFSNFRVFVIKNFFDSVISVRT